MHKHRAKTNTVRPFAGGLVSDRPDPGAHGWTTVYSVCSCGAERRSNVNGRFTEFGYWLEPVKRDSLAGEESR
jgi:hypothetical protein